MTIHSGIIGVFRPCKQTWLKKDENTFCCQFNNRHSKYFLCLFSQFVENKTKEINFNNILFIDRIKICQSHHSHNHKICQSHHSHIGSMTTTLNSNKKAVHSTLSMQVKYSQIIVVTVCLSWSLLFSRYRCVRMSKDCTID